MEKRLTSHHLTTYNYLPTYMYMCLQTAHITSNHGTPLKSIQREEFSLIQGARKQVQITTTSHPEPEQEPWKTYKSKYVVNAWPPRKIKRRDWREKLSLALWTIIGWISKGWTSIHQFQTFTVSLFSKSLLADLGSLSETKHTYNIVHMTFMRCKRIEQISTISPVWWTRTPGLQAMLITCCSLSIGWSSQSLNCTGCKVQ